MWAVNRSQVCYIHSSLVVAAIDARIDITTAGHARHTIGIHYCCRIAV